MKTLLNQMHAGILLLLLSCRASSKSHWDCNELLPEEFKIVQNRAGDKYAIQYGRSQRRVDSYEEKKERWEYTYYYLGENENGWVVQVPLGGERQFDDSCAAKIFYALFAEQEGELKERSKKRRQQEQTEKESHSY